MSTSKRVLSEHCTTWKSHVFQRKYLHMEDEQLFRSLKHTNGVVYVKRDLAHSVLYLEIPHVFPTKKDNLMHTELHEPAFTVYLGYFSRSGCLTFISSLCAYTD